MATWHVSDLTTATRAAPADNAPRGYAFNAQGTRHVNYRGGGGHVYELWWDQAGWHLADLTVATNAAVIDEFGEPRGYVFNAQGTQHVNYRRGADGHVYELWWDQTGWHVVDLTVASGGPGFPFPASAPHGYMFDSQGTQHVNYIGEDGHVYELWWDQTGWHFNDLTVATGALLGSNAHGYMFDAQGTQHVNYVGDGHVYEWDQAGWHFNDLTAATGAPLADIAVEPHGYMFDAQGTRHVNYRGDDGHVYELLWDQAGWHFNDLTAATGAPLADSGPHGYMFDAQGTRHVNYRGDDGHVYELWWG